MRLNILLVAVFVAMPLSLLSGQEKENEIQGSWLGRLSVRGVQLRMVMNISETGEGQLKATLDSPDQGAKDIPMGKVILWEDSIKIEAPLISGFYLGRIVSGSNIEGTWTQFNVTYAMDLEKQAEPFVLRRPQEPKPPYPYLEEEVTFTNKEDNATLAGTLTLPDQEGKFAAVVLVTGSGSQNRDEEIFGHKPFKVIADHLTRNGIAVLRYDDRGVGGSTGSLTGVTSLNFSRDARAAVDYLRTRDDIDRRKIGIIGHSEGGLIALMLATSRDIAFIVSLAGPGVSGQTILEDQSEYISRLNGVSEEEIAVNNELNHNIYRLMIEIGNPETGLAEIQSYIGTYYRSKGYGEEIITEVQGNITNSLNASAYAWLRYFIMSDPEDYFLKIKCPVLALNGSKDCQVLAEKNISAIIEGLEGSGNRDVTGQVLPSLNHLFQECETGLVEEYGEIEQTIDPGVLKMISDWINKRF